MSLRPDLDDAALAESFRHLESEVCDARNAAIVAEHINDQCFGNRGVDLARLGLRTLPDGYVVFMLTADQDDAFQYALHHVGDVCRQLSTAYYAALERAHDHTA